MLSEKFTTIKNSPQRHKDTKKKEAWGIPRSAGLRVLSLQISGIARIGEEKMKSPQIWQIIADSDKDEEKEKGILNPHISLILADFDKQERRSILSRALTR
ncbi:MAG: hypothetical protein HY801_16235 [Candidatus Lindowbacteria bacterium]|nr:hypothetical protein [Candidatus Lindowbacteria bacterium]